MSLAFAVCYRGRGRRMLKSTKRLYCCDIDVIFCSSGRYIIVLLALPISVGENVNIHHQVRISVSRGTTNGLGILPMAPSGIHSCTGMDVHSLQVPLSFGKEHVADTSSRVHALSEKKNVRVDSIRYWISTQTMELSFFYSFACAHIPTYPDPPSRSVCLLARLYLTEQMNYVFPEICMVFNRKTLCLAFPKAINISVRVIEPSISDIVLSADH